MKCSQVDNLLSAYLDGELSEVERAAVDEHLRDCPACTGAFHGLKATVALVSSLPRRPAPRAFAGEVQRRVEQEAESGRPPAAKPGVQRRRTLFAIACYAAAAAILLAVGLAGYLALEPETGTRKPLGVAHDKAARRAEQALALRRGGSEASEADRSGWAGDENARARGEPGLETGLKRSGAMAALGPGGGRAEVKLVSAYATVQSEDVQAGERKVRAILLSNGWLAGDAGQRGGGPAADADRTAPVRINAIVSGDQMLAFSKALSSREDLRTSIEYGHERLVGGEEAEEVLARLDTAQGGGQPGERAGLRAALKPEEAHRAPALSEIAAPKPAKEMPPADKDALWGRRAEREGRFAASLPAGPEPSAQPVDHLDAETALKDVKEALAKEPQTGRPPGPAPAPGRSHESPATGPAGSAGQPVCRDVDEDTAGKVKVLAPSVEAENGDRLSHTDHGLVREPSAASRGRPETESRAAPEKERIKPAEKSTTEGVAVATDGHVAGTTLAGARPATRPATPRSVALGRGRSQPAAPEGPPRLGEAGARAPASAKPEGTPTGKTDRYLGDKLHGEADRLKEARPAETKALDLARGGPATQPAGADLKTETPAALMYSFRRLRQGTTLQAKKPAERALVVYNVTIVIEPHQAPVRAAAQE